MVVDDQQVAAIDKGLLVLVGVERGDTQAQADRLLDRLLGYRVFADDANKMNLSLTDVRGGLLLVPQFTLPANTNKGMRPSFSPAAEPATGKRLFDHLVARAREKYSPVEAGRFGASMSVTLTNHGPVTFMLRTGPD